MLFLSVLPVSVILDDQIAAGTPSGIGDVFQKICCGTVEGLTDFVQMLQTDSIRELIVPVADR